VKNYHVAQWK